MKSLKPRLLTAAIGIPSVVLVIILSEMWSPLVGIVVGLASGLMVGEYLFAKKLLRFVPLAVVSIAYAIAVPTLIYWSALCYIATFVFLMLAFIFSLTKHEELDFLSMAYAMFGTLLITFGMSAVSAACCLNNLSVSFYFVLIFALPWMADAGGFFVGSMLGRHKLCPKISPKKTVEGVIGGIVFCLASAIVMGLVFQTWILDGRLRVNYIALAVIAVLDSVLSVVGDLSFSWIKRSLNIKDYGSIFPGHGGMLDRCDSIIFTAPLVIAIGYYLPFITVME